MSCLSQTDEDRVRAADLLHLGLAQKSASAFMSYVLRDEKTNERIKQAPIHQAWQALINQHRRLLIWSSVESGKSSQVSVGRTLFELGRNTGLRCCIVSNTQGQAGKIGGMIAKYIEGSVDLHEVFPDLLPDEPWTSSQLFVKRQTMAKDPSVQVCGIHGNITGSRLDVLILDDVLDYENCRTPGLRQDLWDWYHATLSGRLTADARVIVIGTAYHPEDFLHRLARTGGWAAFRYPVIDPDTNEIRWPERWPESRIEAKRIELGPLEFARQMMCVARDDAEARFKKEWIDLCLARGSDREPRPSLESVPPGCRTITGVDLAVSRKKISGDTIFFTILVYPNGDRELLWIDGGKYSGPEIVDKLIDTHRRFGSVMYVENNAAQEYILQFARSESAVTVQPFTTGRNKANPEFGIESLAVEMANGKWIIPCKDGHIHKQVSMWIQEMLYYSPAAHTGDRLMASWFAREGVGRAKKRAWVGRINNAR